ncbi:MAG: ABC transporter permease [Bacilli bacterium]|nr:ABC transporter permease [Bacilli bacterium]
MEQVLDKPIIVSQIDMDEYNAIDKDLFTPVELDKEESEHLAAEPYSYWKSVFRVFIHKPGAIIAIISLALFLLSIILIPLFAPSWAYEFHVTDTQFKATGIINNMPPSWAHLFGTDSVGRDLFFCCFTGAGKSLLLAIISSAIIIVIGTLVGLFWGFMRKLDPIFIELYNLISNIPSLLLYMLLAIVLRESFPTMTAEVRLIISLTIFGWLGLALFIRNQTLIITNREYNIASKALGTPAWRIMMKNLLPYLLAVIITDASLLIPGMVSSEVSMSYFGLGLPKVEISIGAILNLGIADFNQYPWQLIAPAFILAWIIFTFYLLGVSLSDALDPKTHR